MKPATTKNHSHHFYSDDEHSEDKKMSKDYLDFNEQVQNLETMSAYEFLCTELKMSKPYETGQFHRRIERYLSKQWKDKIIKYYLQKRDGKKVQEYVKYAHAEENVDEYVEEYATGNAVQ